MIALEVTSITASILALLMFVLTLQVSVRRGVLGKAANDLTAVVFGDGGDEVLRRRIRAFGNYIEYAPMCLIMLALVEIKGASQGFLWSLSGLLITGVFFMRQACCMQITWPFGVSPCL